MAKEKKKNSKGGRTVPSAYKGNSNRTWIILLLVAGSFFALRLMNPNAKPVEELSETAFRAAINEGRVAEVSRVRDLDAGSTYLLGKMKEEDKAFRVQLVPGENERLMAFLVEKGVECPVRERDPVIGPFLQQLIFFVLIGVVFWFFMFRKMGGGGGPFGFGKSRAKLLNEDKSKKKVTFNDVAGVDEAKEEVQEVVEFLKSPARFTKLGGRIPKGVLLVGPPGTGKTLLAKAIAGEAKVPFFSISGSDFEEMFVGVGASRVRDMFEQAKKAAPCLLFIDEIDAVGAKRTGTNAFGSHANDQTLNAMLVEMDGFDGNDGIIIIAATNRPDVLDPALLRPGRFDRQIYVDLPTLKGREDILKLHGARIKFAKNADLARIARGTPGFSGADLANLLNEAALLAVRRKLDGVTHEVLEEARDKVLWGRERKSACLTQKDRETTAWHEAGHALLQLLLPNTDPLHKVTIIPRGRALGATMALPEKDVLNRTRNYFLDELCVCCGGRIAEELFTHDISTGAAQDIASATQIARDMVCRYGMSAKYGFQSFCEANRFTEAELPPPYSEATAQGIDAEVKTLVDGAYARAEDLIRKNKMRLEKLATYLLENESVDGRDVEELLGITKSTPPSDFVPKPAADSSTVATISVS